MCFLSDHLCRPIFAEPFISDHLGQVICPFGPCLLLIPYVNVACFHCPACAAMLMVQVQEVTSTRRLMARFKTSLIWTKDKLWDILHTTSDIWVVNRWGCVKNRKVSPPLSHNGWIPWLGFLKSSPTWWKWFFTHKSFKFFSGLQWAPEYLQLKSRFFHVNSNDRFLRFQGCNAILLLFSP